MRKHKRIIAISLVAILVLAVLFIPAQANSVMDKYIGISKEFKPTNSYNTYRYADFVKVLNRLAEDETVKTAEMLNKHSGSYIYLPCPVSGTDNWGIVKMPAEYTKDAYGFLLSNDFIQVVTVTGAATVKTMGIIKGNGGEYRAVEISPAEYVTVR